MAFSGLKLLIKHFLTDRKGAIAVIGVAFMPIFVLLIGVSVDYYKASSAKSAAQHAADSAVLSLMRQQLLESDNLETIAQQFVKESLAPFEKVTINKVSVTRDVDSSELTIALDLSYETMLLGLLGDDAISINTQAKAGFEKEIDTSLTVLFQNTARMSIGATDEDREILKGIGTRKRFALSGKDSNAVEEFINDPDAYTYEEPHYISNNYNVTYALSEDSETLLRLQQSFSCDCACHAPQTDIELAENNTDESEGLEGAEEAQTYYDHILIGLREAVRNIKGAYNIAYRPYIGVGSRAEEGGDSVAIAHISDLPPESGLHQGDFEISMRFIQQDIRESQEEDPDSNHAVLIITNGQTSTKYFYGDVQGYSEKIYLHSGQISVQNNFICEDLKESGVTVGVVYIPHHEIYNKLQQSMESGNLSKNSWNFIKLYNSIREEYPDAKSFSEMTSSYFSNLGFSDLGIDSVEFEYYMAKKCASNGYFVMAQSPESIYQGINDMMSKLLFPRAVLLE